MDRQLQTPVGEASLTQSKALAWTPKFTAALSLIGSGYIIYDILCRTPKNKRRVYNKIMLGMSLSDFFCSIAWFCTTWPIPPEVFPAFGARGTQATCTAQGFFTQFSVCTVFYNGFLALYYLLVIRFGWTEDHLKKSNFAPTVHATSLFVGLSTSIACVSLGLLNPIGWDCWIASVPLGCQESWQNDGETTCTRGDNANLYQWLFFYLPTWLIIILVSIAMSKVYFQFRRRVKKSMDWSTSLTKRYSINVETGGDQQEQQQQQQAQQPQSKLEFQKEMLRTQMVLYVGSFYVVWLFPTILRITEIAGDSVWFHWVYLSGMFVPFQGFLNMIVFVRPRWMKYRAEQTGHGSIYRMTTNVHPTTNDDRALSSHPLRVQARSQTNEENSLPLKDEKPNGMAHHQTLEQTDSDNSFSNPQVENLHGNTLNQFPNNRKDEMIDVEDCHQSCNSNSSHSGKYKTIDFTGTVKDEGKCLKVGPA